MHTVANKNLHKKAQRWNGLRVMGARINTAQATLTVYVYPLEWHLKGLAAIGTLRLRESNLERPTNNGRKKY